METTTEQNPVRKSVKEVYDYKLRCAVEDHNAAATTYHRARSDRGRIPAERDAMDALNKFVNFRLRREGEVGNLNFSFIELTTDDFMSFEDAMVVAKERRLLFEAKGVHKFDYWLDFEIERDENGVAICKRVCCLTS